MPLLFLMDVGIRGKPELEYVRSEDEKLLSIAGGTAPFSIDDTNLMYVRKALVIALYAAGLCCRNVGTVASPKSSWVSRLDVLSFTGTGMRI